MTVTRRLRALCCTLSATAFVVVCVLWAGSLYRHDSWFTERKQVSGAYWKVRRIENHSVSGRFVSVEVDVRHLPMRQTQPAKMSTVKSMMIEQLPWTDLPRTGLRWQVEDSLAAPAIAGQSSTWTNHVATTRTVRTRWTVMYWAAALVLAVPPLAWVAVRAGRARLAERRTQAGRCAACGYDLRASPERCPECGTLAAEAGTRDTARDARPATSPASAASSPRAAHE